MSVELKVVLVGDDPQQQDAFNNPSASSGPSIPPVQPVASQATQVVQPPPVQYVERESQESSNEPSIEPTSPSQVVPPPIQSTQPTKQATVEAPPVQSVEAPPVQTDENRLIDSIEHLIESIDALSEVNSSKRTPTEKPNKSGDAASSVFENFAKSIDQKLSDIGVANTSVGNMVSNLVHMVTGAGSRVAKAAGSVIDPVIGRAATGAATKAVSTGATEASVAGGAAVAGAGEAAGGLAAVAAAAGPVGWSLVALGVGVGASVLTVKAFVDAVEGAAKELEDLSPQIARVRAQHEVTMELAKLDRSRRIGGDIAGLEQARTRINESMYEVQTKIYEIALKGAPVLEGILTALNVMARQIDVHAAGVAMALALMTKDKEDDKKAATDVANAAAGFANALNEFRNQNAPPPMRDPIFEEILHFRLDQDKVKAPRKGNGLGGGK